ncbi:MAG: hypothetical protein IPJ04_03055 [Candidatus Eisenbacteria bacterium]|nr:hypothetical protein [Candidatus Eisenbacteria bacterium]
MLPMRERGELSLSALVTLAPVLTPSNARALLEGASGRTARARSSPSIARRTCRRRRHE